MRIHAGTLGTLPREVGRSLGGNDQVFLPGNKTALRSMLSLLSELPNAFSALCASSPL